ncbi:MAG: hypothetical protein JXB49_27315 [Bacteroidales bacterium]|nr:hypothetical protein [Bacteroidales bacterium]
MLKKPYPIFTAGILPLIFLAVFFIGCKSDGSKTNTDETEDIEDVEIDQEIFDDIKEAKKIFYSLPSPLETAMLIKTAGAEYNEELLNSLDNVDNYTTNKSMALNLGVYTTDLSFASLFDQTQTSINYMEASKKLADGLEILDAIDNTTIERLEENINNRDVIMDIISETFMSSSSFLKENDRAAVASIVLVGGWVEGLYIATQLVGEKPIENNKLVERIVDQKLSFDIVLKLLEEHKDNPDIQDLIADVNKLKQVFDKIELETTEIETEVGEDNVTTLKSTSTIKITKAIFQELTETVETIRTKFVS